MYWLVYEDEVLVESVIGVCMGGRRRRNCSQKYFGMNDVLRFGTTKDVEQGIVHSHQNCTSKSAAGVTNNERNDNCTTAGDPFVTPVSSLQPKQQTNFPAKVFLPPFRALFVPPLSQQKGKIVEKERVLIALIALQSPH
ncbi:hypothetical protein CDAR_43261 [Caerostris darwini]|uniref:Uncharacterized protein n=1 Tax=Caerostris darwini TaxID=1538125 RepID=A0AAV4WI51_9ARAC|nr:hypothetical protein CDAR_43261 [Caerostris darwini]